MLYTTSWMLGLGDQGGVCIRHSHTTLCLETMSLELQTPGQALHCKAALCWLLAVLRCCAAGPARVHQSCMLSLLSWPVFGLPFLLLAWRPYLLG